MLGFFSDLADVVVDRLADGVEKIVDSAVWLGGMAVDAAGNFSVNVYGIAQSLVCDDGVIIPRARLMSETECRWASDKIFGSSLPKRDKIIITNLRGGGSFGAHTPQARHGQPRG